MTIRTSIGQDRALGRSRTWRFTQRFFLVTGLLSLGYAAYNYGSGYVYQTYGTWAFNRSLARRSTAHPPASLTTPVVRIPQSSPPAATGSSTRKSLMESLVGSPVGEIVIPRLGISAVIKEGVDDITLRLAVGHFPSTAVPGEPGNVGVVAHRDTLFRKLKYIQQADEITVTTLNGQFVYRVIWFKVVDPTEVSVLAPSVDENTLTLVTCFPFYFIGHAPKRFIVRARQVESSSQHRSHGLL